MILPHGKCGFSLGLEGVVDHAIESPELNLLKQHIIQMTTVVLCFNDMHTKTHKRREPHSRLL